MARTAAEKLAKPAAEAVKTHEEPKLGGLSLPERGLSALENIKLSREERALLSAVSVMRQGLDDSLKLVSSLITNCMDTVNADKAILRALDSREESPRRKFLAHAVSAGRGVVESLSEERSRLLEIAANSDKLVSNFFDSRVKAEQNAQRGSAESAKMLVQYAKRSLLRAAKDLRSAKIQIVSENPADEEA